MTEPTNVVDQTAQQFQLLAFLSSIGIVSAVSVATTLSTSSQFLGRQDPDTLASMQRSALLFTWSALAFGLELVILLLVQMLFSRKPAQRVLKGQAWAELATEVVLWIGMCLVGAATAVGVEGVKLMTKTGASIIQ
jgi:hypothetical protein